MGITKREGVIKRKKDEIEVGEKKKEASTNYQADVIFWKQTNEILSP